ncbi:hypothetical protein [Chryseobacterium sp. PMSZPI]|uniref:hypothetical protein n=1 Tax=Chryseobacterium sp. PMSZPI TaxID=1033900 RepID=UPI000C33FBF6|nr:hypothetical protein [Chryseobacterium sp. PMSZPI]PKF74036.1 hypothetical protein CW752_11565 [Chryseobacterium sp. PMSZPI]
MKKKSLLPCLLLAQALFGQIGLNTNVPKSTLDVVAKTTDGSKPEGFIAPRLTGDQIKAGDAQYTTDQKGNMVYATSEVGIPSAKTMNIQSEGYYYFDGKVWQSMQSRPGLFTTYHVGDIKNSLQITDHDNWYLLNGRQVSSLPTNAQSAANFLGFTINIPDATDRVLKTKSIIENLGDIGGTNVLKLTQANLPAVNLSGIVSGTTADAGSHNHAAGAGGFLLGGTTVGNNGTGNLVGNAPNNAAWGGIGSLPNTAVGGVHNHNFSATANVPTGGSSQALDNRSAYLTVNTFIYLGQ